MHRTDLMDTAEWAHRLMVERYRAMTPEERIRIMVGQIEMGREVHSLAMKRLKGAQAQESVEPDI
jgi:hypothetical protein